MRLIFVIFLLVVNTFAYTNLTPKQVHDRLLAQDHLLLLDVREVYEYTDGHIAEPSGRPVIIPANLPISSGVLKAEYPRLPQDIDIIVYCRSGGRSAAASSFLQGKGFTRIFNMTGGFSSWSYESRDGSIGRDAGQWIDRTGGSIKATGEQSATLVIPAKAISRDSVYVELHAHTAANAPFAGGEFYLQWLLLDPFGISLAAARVEWTEAPRLELQLPANQQLAEISGFAGQWYSLDFSQQSTLAVTDLPQPLSWIRYHIEETTLVTDRHPANHELVKLYPNPFNGRLKIDAPAAATVTIFDTMGRQVGTAANGAWQPDARLASGVYFVHIQIGHQIQRYPVTLQR